MGFRGSRVQIPPSRLAPAKSGGESFRRDFANAARSLAAFWSNPAVSILQSQSIVGIYADGAFSAFVLVVVAIISADLVLLIFSHNWSGALPSSHRIDVERRLVITRVWGVATDEDVLGHNARLRADPLFDPTFKQLADMSGITQSLVSTETINQVSRGQLFTPGTQRAMVAYQEAIYGLLRKYEQQAESAGQVVRVFREMKDAEAWLNL